MFTFSFAATIAMMLTRAAEEPRTKGVVQQITTAILVDRVTVLVGDLLMFFFVVQAVHDRISVDITVTEKQMDFIKLLHFFAVYGHTAFENAVRKRPSKEV